MKFTILITIFGVLLINANVNAAKIHSLNNAVATPNFGSAVVKFVNAFKKIMPCGYEPWHIPALAPFTLDAYNLNINKEYLSINGSVSNIEVSGLNSFRFIEFAFNSTNNRTNFDIIFPSLQFLAEDNNINIWALLAGYPATLATDGIMNIKLKDVRFVGDFIFSVPLTSPNGLQITDFNINTYLADAFFNSWNNLWDISLNNFVNRFARDFLLMWVQQMRQEINVWYQEMIYSDIKLDDISLYQLTNMFVEFTDQLSSAQCSTN